MNITYLIGNGFDKAIGLETGYDQFYDYLKVNKKEFFEEYPFMNPFRDKKLWSDLEIGLGKITQEFENTEKSINEFTNFYKELTIELSNYIKNENNKIEILPDKLDVHIGFGFNAVFSELTEVEQSIIPNYEINRVNNYYFISFNYTDILDNWISKLDRKVHTYLGNPYQDKYNIPLHIHNNLNNRTLPILGVNDISQIANKSIAEDIKRLIVKPIINDTYGFIITNKVSTVINNSNLICIYGLSLGDTDKMWWNEIGNWILKNSSNNLIIFSFNNSMFNNVFADDLYTKKEKVKENFIKHTNLSYEKNKSVIDKQIFALFIDKDTKNPVSIDLVKYQSKEKELQPMA